MGDEHSPAGQPSGPEPTDPAGGGESSRADDPGRPPPDEPRRVLRRRYELLERIGEGPRGVVWRVRHRNLDRECALKLIRPAFARDKRTFKRLLREARRIAGLRHPNIVTIYDVWRDGEAVGIEMELVRGRSLAEILDKTPDRLLPLGWVIEVMDQLCSALQAAHN
jgi:serine/threonine-protein kinase